MSNALQLRAPARTCVHPYYAWPSPKMAEQRTSPFLPWAARGDIRPDKSPAVLDLMNLETGSSG